MVYPHGLCYACIAMLTTVTRHYKIKASHRRAYIIRCVTDSHFWKHTLPVFSKLHIFQLDDLVEINMVKHLHILIIL